MRLNWTKKTVLITGAGGFIGSHLTEHLVELGANVKAFVRYNSRNDWGLLELLPKQTLDKIEVIMGDLRDADVIRHAAKEVDVIFHLGSPDLVNYHKRNGAIATIALKKRDVKIDFGVVEIDFGNSIEGYKEKPKIEYLVSMGVYAFEPRVLEYIKLNEYLDFPDLIKKLISNGETVKGYVYDGYWLDIGRPEDYEKANRDINTIHDKLGLDTK